MSYRIFQERSVHCIITESNQMSAYLFPYCISAYITYTLLIIERHLNEIISFCYINKKDYYKNIGEYYPLWYIYCHTSKLTKFWLITPTICGSQFSPSHFVVLSTESSSREQNFVVRYTLSDIIQNITRKSTHLTI